MRVVSWNLAYMTPGKYKAHKNRRRQWSLIASLDPDIILLQECRPEDLKHYGLDDGYIIIGEVPTGWTACSAVMVHKELNPHPISHSSSWRKFLSGYLSLAEITEDEHRVLVASVHSPADRANNPLITKADHESLRRKTCDVAWYSDVAFGVLKSLTNEFDRFIIGGDWNECRKFDQLHQYNPGSGRELFERTLKAGWHESLRRYHREEVPTYLKPGTGGYELDHLFTDSVLESRLARCDVLKETPIPEISDHAAIIADFS